MVVIADPGFVGVPEVVWLRPKDISGVTSPVLLHEGIESEDVVCPILKLGMTSHSWLLSCMAILASRPKQLRKLFVSDKYADRGLYVVKLFKQGAWQYVVVDDQIPCSAETQSPIFAGSSEVNEIWVNILMKAYAKVHCTYEALSDRGKCC